MESIEFIFDRLVATHSAAVTLTGSWQWPEKSVAQFETDVSGFDALRQQEGAADLAVRQAAGQWDAVLSSVATQASAVKRYAVTKFRQDEGKSRMWRSIDLVYNSRPAIYRVGCLVRDAWRESDQTWVPEPGLTFASFSALVADALNKQATHQAKLNQWRKAAGDLSVRARACEQDCINWYRDATTRFSAESAEGQMVRSTVPTTTRPVEPVGQAVISNLQVSGGDIQFDCTATHATRFTYFHRPPGVPNYFVLSADTPASHVSLQNQPPGEHFFKAVGSNSRGSGPESESVSVTLAQAQAA
jgi:hypothetical protein